MTPLNHREIEFYTKKRWENNNFQLDNLKDMFSDWENENQKKAALELMDWLEIKGELLFDQDLIMDYGTDCLRVYLMFEKEPKENDKYYDSWEECNLEGAYKFIGKFRRMILTADIANEKGCYENKDVQKLISKVDEISDLMMEHLAKGNTMPNRHNAISAIMEGFKYIQTELNIGEYLVKFHSHEIQMAVPHSESVVSDKEINNNDIHKNAEITKLCRKMIILMAPFTPFISDELMQHFDDNVCIFQSKLILNRENAKRKISIPLQVNGKTKKVLDFDEDASDDEIKNVTENEAMRYLKDSDYEVVYINKKIINYTTKNK